MPDVADTRYWHRPWEWMSLREQIVDARLDEFLEAQPPTPQRVILPPRFFGVERGAPGIEDALATTRPIRYSPQQIRETAGSNRFSLRGPI